MSVDVGPGGNKRVLWNVSGHASHGHVLAIMGPSGELKGGGWCRVPSPLPSVSCKGNCNRGCTNSSGVCIH